jgi:SHS2 domain-containing protein
MAYEFLEHTADIKIRATGKTLSEALKESAKALFHAIAGDSQIKPSVTKEYSFKIHKPEMLVHHFLTEILFLHASENLLFSEFELDLKQSLGYFLKARVSGEEYDPKKHKLNQEVKAVTYHELKVCEENGEWVIEVVCDI